MTLTPFYDIVNISLYQDKYEQDMAMGIDEEFCLEKLKPYDFQEFYKTININKKVFSKEYKTISKIIIDTLNLKNFETTYLDEDFINIYEENVIQRINYLNSII